MDGVLLVDKPSGPTSHDIVARLRSVSGERSIGHTGTLDPLASGLLPLVLGRATRLAQFLTGGDKTYDAVIRLGSFTDTDDAQGQAVPDAGGGPRPDDAALDAALTAFRGTFLQVPPRHSAKKIAGHKAYDLARQDRPVDLDPVSVTVRSLDLISRSGDDVRLTVTATAGFYVRALARDIGQALGCGAHLAALRRTRSGTFGVEQALPFADVERLGRDVERHLLSPSEALRDLAVVTVTELGLRRARHGNPLSPEHLSGRWVPPGAAPVRVLDEAGRLVALAYARGGALHPSVVLS
ncbi:MAG TPA: tRNA pseudouridine(55) synthase TruB [Vicinamibacterales bacterium]|nr:tRNA pseudouridine(55) synthase TruB [Vicinamibacterales bacterium]